jgi:hypothetical protein
VRLRQIEQGPVATPDDLGAIFFFNG